MNELRQYRDKLKALVADLQKQDTGFTTESAAYHEGKLAAYQSVLDDLEEMVH